MKTVTVSEFQKQFPSLWETVKQGEAVTITSGTNGQTVAVLMPASQEPANQPRKLGLLAHLGPITIYPDFEMTEEEFLNS